VGPLPTDVVVGTGADPSCSPRKKSSERIETGALFIDRRYRRKGRMMVILIRYAELA